MTKTIAYLIAAVAAATPGGSQPWSYTPPSDVSVGAEEALAHAYKAVGKCLTLPHQLITETTDVLAVSWHVSGMQYVSARIDNGAEWKVYAPITAAAIGNLRAYKLTVDPALCTVGKHKMVICCMPTSGIPRYIEYDFFTGATPTVRYVSPTGNNANDGLTALTPMIDPGLAAASMCTGDTLPDHAVIYLAPGRSVWKHTTDYAWVTQAVNSGWLILSAMPGHDEADTFLDLDTEATPYTWSLKKLALRDLGFENGTPYYESSNPILVWSDGCYHTGGDWADDATVLANKSARCTYFTNCVIDNMGGSPTSSRGTLLMIGCDLSFIREGGAWLVPCLVNTHFHDISIILGAHTDFWRTFAELGDHENIVLYGNTSTLENIAQGFAFFVRANTGDPLLEYSNVAIVENDISANILALSLGGVCRHFYIKDNVWRGLMSNQGFSAAPENAKLYDGDETVVLEGNTYYDYATSTPTVPTPGIENATVR